MKACNLAIFLCVAVSEPLSYLVRSEVLLGVRSYSLFDIPTLTLKVDEENILNNYQLKIESQGRRDIQLSYPEAIFGMDFKINYFDKSIEVIHKKSETDGIRVVGECSESQE